MTSSSSLHLVPVQIQGVELLCDISQGSLRPLIPEQHRREVFAVFHGLGHAGARATRRLMSARGVWRGMSSDINAWVRGLAGGNLLRSMDTAAFVSTWVARFGVPAVVTSDRGAHFTSVVWHYLCSLAGIAISTTLLTTLRLTVWWSGRTPS